MGKTGGKGLSLARRLYASRSLGLAAGLVCVAAAMYPLDPAPWVWAIMLFNGIFWPHLAYLWSRRATVPYHAEHRNLLIDAFLGGFWVAAMQFNPLPSAATIAMMAMNNVAIGGLRFLLVGTVAQILGVIVGFFCLLRPSSLKPVNCSYTPVCPCCVCTRWRWAGSAFARPPRLAGKSANCSP